MRLRWSPGMRQPSGRRQPWSEPLLPLEERMEKIATFVESVCCVIAGGLVLWLASYIGLSALGII